MKNNPVARLRNNQPLFDSIPIPHSPVIIGVEMELGSSREAITTQLFGYDKGFPRLPTWLQNGGRMYIDLEHLEVSTPETSNAVSAAIYTRACLEIVREQFSEDIAGQPIEWYAHNTDWVANTFGGHESYSTTLSPESCVQLCPFLVARTILTGIGWIDQKNCFSISQRAPYIVELESEQTQYDRGLICLRPYEKEKSKKPHRLHLICGESNLNQIALFIKFGFTALVIELLEIGELPKMDFHPHGLLEDLWKISSSSENWIFDREVKDPNDCWLFSSLEKSINAIDLNWLYLEQVHRCFGGRDVITDTIIDVTAYKLGLLKNFEQNLPDLSRMSDWVAKIFLERVWYDEGDAEIPLSVQDMEYHRLGDGWQNHSERSRGADLLVPMECTKRAVTEPPIDTRASLRGWLQKKLEEKGNDWKLNPDLKDWSRCVITQGAYIYRTVDLPDPFDSFHGYRKELETWLNKM